MLRIFRLTGLLLLALVAQQAHAEDAKLAELRGLLVPMRAGTDTDPKTRGATPALMTVKHRLRDWIESRLAALEENGDEQALAVHLNDELSSAGLFCRDVSKDAPDRCVEKDMYWDSIGFLKPIRIDRQQPRILILRTSVGILCGSDDSAYVYEWRDDKWWQLWQSEQAIEAGKPYSPQYITGISVSRPDERTQHRLVLSLGHMGWCSSNFYPVFFRLWRAEPAGASKLLLDEKQGAYLAAHDPPIEGSVGATDALIEFTVTSLDTEVHSYEAIRHYKILGERVERIDPIALGPRDFVEEWLKGSWRESSAWTTRDRRVPLRPWHVEFHRDHISGDYIDMPKRCRETPDLWQVGIDFGDADKSLGVVYFLVRWRPPYDFEMADVRTKPRGDCNQRDEPDGSLNTLFPVQEWR